MSISAVIPQLRTTDLAESILFYTTKVGLTLEFQYKEFYAGIRAGTQLFHLKLVDEKDPSIQFVNSGEFEEKRNSSCEGFARNPLGNKRVRCP